MERAKKIIISVILLIISLFMQLFVIDNMSLLGVKPNLFLISIIVISLNTDIYISTVYSFIIEVILDLLFGAGGLFTISYVVIAMILGVVKEDYMSENLFSISILTSLSVTIFELIQYFKSMIVISKFVSLLFLLKQLILSILLNVVITVIVCYIFKKILYKKEDKLYW